MDLEHALRLTPLLKPFGMILATVRVTTVVIKDIAGPDAQVVPESLDRSHAMASMNGVIQPKDVRKTEVMSHVRRRRIAVTHGVVQDHVLPFNVLVQNKSLSHTHYKIGWTKCASCTCILYSSKSSTLIQLLMLRLLSMIWLCFAIVLCHHLEHHYPEAV